MPALPSALERSEEIREALGERFAVFLDFDGTLSPIVEDPEDAQLPASTREVLAELAERVPVAIVSGRALADVRERVGLEGLVYAGDHGFAIDGLDEAEVPRPEGLETEMAAVRRALEERLAGVGGVRLEAKPFSMAVHHRQAPPEAADRVREAVDEALTEASTLTAREGKQVVEVVPSVDWDKGKAVELVLAGIEGSPTPLYIGDDTTDEAALEAIAGEGVGIRVGEGRETAGTYRLADPGEVRAFLTELIPGRGCGGEL